jgi:hypothetical protein
MFRTPHSPPFGHCQVDWNEDFRIERILRLLDINMNHPKVGFEELLFCRIYGSQKRGFCRLPAHGTTEPLLNRPGSMARVIHTYVVTAIAAFCPF